jgi:hypothetical protein
MNPLHRPSFYLKYIFFFLLTVHLFPDEKFPVETHTKIWAAVADAKTSLANNKQVCLSLFENNF